jgi:hypothetical protein
MPLPTSLRSYGREQVAFLCTCRDDLFHRVVLAALIVQKFGTRVGGAADPTALGSGKHARFLGFERAARAGAGGSPKMTQFTRRPFPFQ